MFITKVDPYFVSTRANTGAIKADEILMSVQQIQDLLADRYRDRDADGFLDISPDEKLSANFKYKELIASDNAAKFGLENRVPADRLDIVQNARFTAANLLEICRNQFGGFTPNSWYRGPEVEYAATYRDGFVKYIKKAYRRSRNDEPTANDLITIVQSTMFLRDLIKTARNGKSQIHAIVLHLWNTYYEGKQHPRGEAVDFEIPASKSNQALWDWIRTSTINYDQLILEFHKPSAGAFSGWVHGSITEESRTGRKNRRSAFSI